MTKKAPISIPPSSSNIFEAVTDAIQGTIPNEKI
jgi:hypothetical protein